MNLPTRSLVAQHPASFEPAIDYVVTKVPRFTFEKFPQADSRLTTQMKSVGEVMAIGRSFQESMQKALRGLEIGVSGLDPTFEWDSEEAVQAMRHELAEPRTSPSLVRGRCTPQWNEC
jgi:carbamoyl-phosphate synthase large subunit